MAGARTLTALAGNSWPAYFATPLRLDGLLLGAAIAAGLPAWLAVALRRPWPVVATALAVLLPFMPGDSGWALTFAVPAAAITGAGVILSCLAAPGGRLVRTLEARPVVWLGQRSYSLYLWHYPIFTLAPTATPWPMLWAASALTAEASFRWVEAPGRKLLSSRPTTITLPGSGQAHRSSGEDLPAGGPHHAPGAGNG